MILPSIGAGALMPPWLRPWMVWMAIIAALLAALGVQSLRLAGEKADHADTRSQYSAAVAAAEAKARQTENNMRAALDGIQQLAAKEKEDAKAREDALVESVRAGNRRLSIAAVCPGGAGVNPAAAGGSGAVLPRADIDAAAAERIVTITIDGDQAIRERNACVSAYNAIREQLKGVE